MDFRWRSHGRHGYPSNTVRRVPRPRSYPGLCCILPFREKKAQFTQTRAIRKMLDWKLFCVSANVRSFPAEVRSFPADFRSRSGENWPHPAKRRFPLISVFSVQNLKRAKQMPRAPRSDQTEDLRIPCWSQFKQNLDQVLVSFQFG